MRFATPFGLDIDITNLDHTEFGAGTIKVLDGGGIIVVALTLGIGGHVTTEFVAELNDAIGRGLRQSATLRVELVHTIGINRIVCIFVASQKSQCKQANKGAERTPQGQTRENPAARGLYLMQQG